MENDVFQNQLNNAVNMTVNSFRELITLCKEAIAIGNFDPAKGQQQLADTTQRALTAVQNAASPAGSSPVPASPAGTSADNTSPAPVVATAASELDNIVITALNLSCQNAVSAQRQAYITQQAATTEVIATILSLATQRWA